MANHQSARDWYRDGELAGSPQAIRSLVPQDDRVIQAGPIHVINVSPPAGRVVEPPVPEFGLNLLLRTAPLLRVGFNRPPRWLAVAPGSLLVTPPDTSAEFIGDTEAHALAITIPKAIVEEFTREHRLRIEVRREEAFRDPRLVHQLARLWHALANDMPGARLYADQAMRTLLDGMARRAPGESRAASARSPRERLANHVLRRLVDFIETHLGEELDVPMLAAVAGLSAAHFARAFALTVDMTPFEYVMTRRLARARELLQRTDRSTLAIALDAGFKTPSHFTARFRREFGVTPRDIRPDARRPDAAPEIAPPLGVALA